jgi:hypothetical protein
MKHNTNIALGTPTKDSEFIAASVPSDQENLEAADNSQLEDKLESTGHVLAAINAGSLVVNSMGLNAELSTESLADRFKEASPATSIKGANVQGFVASRDPSKAKPKDNEVLSKYLHDSRRVGYALERSKPETSTQRSESFLEKVRANMDKAIGPVSTSPVVRAISKFARGYAASTAELFSLREFAKSAMLPDIFEQWDDSHVKKLGGF